MSGKADIEKGKNERERENTNTKIRYKNNETSQQKKQLNLKWAEFLDRLFFQRRHTDGQPAQRCTTSQIRKIQINTTMKYHLIFFRISFTKKTEMTNDGEDVEKMEFFYTLLVQFSSVQSFSCVRLFETP